MADPELHRIKEVFCAALEKPPAQRDTFLEAACAGDRALRKKVERSLAAYERAGEFLAEPTEVSIAEMLLGVAAAAPLPERIGQYHVTRIIASGGMGVVYEAVQAHPHRTVALKVMRGGIASRSALRRFEHESQILARLRHPNIAQIYESGTHDDPAAPGAPVPYFAMEYIPNAKNLLEYAHEEKLSSRQRLEMFTKVCEAVHHGHQKGIIHRDLKPGNILVDVTEPGRAGNGHFDLAEPKIIDFGVARATDSDLAVTTLQTDVGQLIGTLQYMSPEQCKADPHDLDSRSDIYALGVVLYQLLCGQLPYDLTRLPVPEAARVIRDESPAKPSTINRTLRGDLETIVLKALEKDRTRRYQSATDLSRDITRYLDDEPILARPPSAAYQLRKFVKRNKALAGGITVALVALVLGTAVATWQAARALAAERLTQVEAIKAVAVKDFLAGMIGATDFIEAGRRLGAKDVLDQAVDDIGESLAAQAEIEAEVRHLIGRSYASMGELAKAIEQLRSAWEMRRRSLGEEHADTLDSADSLAYTLQANYQWNEAEDILRKVVDARRHTLGQGHPDTLWSISRLAQSLNLQRKPEEAEPLARLAFDGLTEILGEEDERTLRARYSLWGALWRNGKPDEAETVLRGGLDIARRVLGDEHWITLGNTRELGAFLWTTKRDMEQVQPLLESSLEAHRRLFGDDHHKSLYWTETYGYILYQSGQTEEGVSRMRVGVEGLRRVLGDRNLKTANSMKRLARVEYGLGHYAEWEALLRTCLDADMEILGEAHRETLDTLNDLAWRLKDGGPEKSAEAEAFAARTVELCPQVHGERHWRTLRARNLLGTVVRIRGRVGEAESLFRALIPDVENALGKGHLLYSVASVQCSRCLIDLERYADAESVLQTLFATMTDLHGEDHTRTVAALIDLYDAWGKPKQAAEWQAKVGQESDEAIPIESGQDP